MATHPKSYSPDPKAQGNRSDFFYLNGELHRAIHLNRAEDILTVYNFARRQKMVYNGRDIRLRRQPAFTTKQVATMINRHRQTIVNDMYEGNIKRPARSWPIRKDYAGRGTLRWSEEDIMAAHEYYATRHFGRPRQDGLVTPLPLPSKTELRAMIRQHGRTVLFTKDKEGDFVPVWKARTIYT